MVGDCWSRWGFTGYPPSPQSGERAQSRPHRQCTCVYVVSSCVRACAGSSEPVKMSEMGVGVACARRDGQRGKRKKWKVKEVSTNPPAPSTSEPGSVRQEKQVLCSSTNAAFTLTALPYVRWSFSETSGGVLFSFLVSRSR